MVAVPLDVWRLSMYVYEPAVVRVMPQIVYGEIAGEAVLITDVNMMTLSPLSYWPHQLCAGSTV